MGRGSSSSQVGLFSTQISEQIVRLRALAQSQEGPTEAHQVDLRRAVMATRLLAGSARILHLDALQQFLDELLGWLQRLEQSRDALNTTQALILESVIELEEALMLHLDEVEDDEGTDLGPFQGQIDDLLTLIRHNADKMTAPPEPESESEATEPAVLETVTGPESLTWVIDWYEETIVDSMAIEELEALLAVLDPSLERLERLRDEATARLASRPQVLDPSHLADGLDPVDAPQDDLVFGGIVEELQERLERVGVQLNVQAFGGARLLAPGMHQIVQEILRHLADDIARAVEITITETHIRVMNLSLFLRAENGRALITIADDGPRLQGSPVHGDPDHLSMLGGLRRARRLLGQTLGLIRVEPSHQPQHRFELSVPLDPDHPRYAILSLEDVEVAVPAALLDEVISASGLLYEADESGESVERGGRSVPLTDLAQFVDDLVPAAQASPSIAVVGSVEKRLGIGCVAEARIVEASELLDAPPGWEAVAYGALDGERGEVPVLDIKQLLNLRFRSADPGDIPGTLHDSRIDSYVPADEEEPVEIEVVEDKAKDLDSILEVPDHAPEATPEPRTFTNALLVNQSEFRRRDLSRTLKGLKLRVELGDDLPSASTAIESGGVDLLVTDLRLGQEGGESFHTLREKYPRLTIVLTSSVAQQYAGELAERTGAHACWLDPYRKSDLQALLAKLQG